MTAILVTAGFDPDITIFGTSNSTWNGYENTTGNAFTGTGSANPLTLYGAQFLAAGQYSAFGTAGWGLVLATGTAQSLFTSVSALHSGVSTPYYATAAQFYASGQNIIVGDRKSVV